MISPIRSADGSQTRGALTSVGFACSPSPKSASYDKLVEQQEKNRQQKKKGNVPVDTAALKQPV
jgi:hypothetical protein